MERENIFGQMDHVMKANLIKELDMVKVVGSQQSKMEIFILVHTKAIRKTVMEDMFGRMVVCIRVASPTMLSIFLII